MPKIEGGIPEGLRAYEFHGLQTNWREGDEDATSECPFCGEGNKLGISLKTGKYNCLRGSCGESGNPTTFLRWLWAESEKATKTEDYKELATNRGLLFPDTLMTWGIAKSILDNRWLVPGFGYSEVSGSWKLQQLYSYREITSKGVKRMSLVPTPPKSMFGSKIHGADPSLFDFNKPIVYLCEGVWDALVLWETLKTAKFTDNGIVPTAGTDNILTSCNVLAVPGCTIFLDKWLNQSLPLFAEKQVVLMYDNDPASLKTKGGLKRAGLYHMERVAGILSSSPVPPESIKYVRWAEIAGIPDSYDIRDLLCIK